MMKKHVNIKVSGEVQGVFFRASTKEIADALEITGFVRNEADGTVYIEAEGEEEKLKRFNQWCRKGPPRARVLSCEVSEGSLAGFEDFLIER